MPDSSVLKRLNLGGSEPGELAAVPQPQGPPVSSGCLSRASLEPWEQGCRLDQAGSAAPLIDLPMRLPPR